METNKKIDAVKIELAEYDLELFENVIFGKGNQFSWRCLTEAGQEIEVIFCQEDDDFEGEE